MSEFIYTKTKKTIDNGYALMKYDQETFVSMVVSIRKDGVSVYTDCEGYNFSQQSTEKEFNEAYLKAMLALGLLDCFQKLGFAMSPTVR